MEKPKFKIGDLLFSGPHFEVAVENFENKERYILFQDKYYLPFIVYSVHIVIYSERTYIEYLDMLNNRCAEEKLTLSQDLFIEGYKNGRK